MPALHNKLTSPCSAGAHRRPVYLCGLYGGQSAPKNHQNEETPFIDLVSRFASIFGDLVQS